ncbi:piggyBac transposable element-derived protein 4-like [Lineus longissimus]|uniref:piggyBac transposable element-derived protein 4-like n=1 Tax=Lineus longissimus TaxID=88925 RepID=UPI00315CA967
MQPEKGQPNYDPLYKVRPVINLVKDTYMNIYQPHQQISADEIMKKFKGRLSFKQYIPNKPNKWGIKIWSLCDSVSGYNLRWNIYTGKDEAAGREMALGSKVVLSLLRGLDDSGHQIFMDNYFSSPDLYSVLKDKGIGACGTVRANRKGLPKNISKAQLPLKQGDRPAFFSCNQLTCTTWQDTARVNCLSSMHGNGVVNKEVRSKKDPTGKRNVIKPALVNDYNQYMGGVDKFDQLSSYYCYPHKCQKWYQVVFNFARETALVNGFIAYKSTHPGENIDQLKFRQKVVDSLIPEAVRERAQAVANTVEERRAKRLQERHFPAEYADKKHRPECAVCSHRPGHRHQTYHYCEQCELPMCAIGCFKRFHTLFSYKVKYN